MFSEDINDEELRHRYVNADRYLTLFLDDEEYGVDIKLVKEIIAVIKTTPVPKTPHYLDGVMNLRGNIIPVVNLRKKLGMEFREIDDRTVIVIISLNESDIGFIIDRVEEVIVVEESAYSEAPEFGSKIDSKLIKNMAVLEEGVAMILDIDKIFDESELDLLESLEEKEES